MGADILGDIVDAIQMCAVDNCQVKCNLNIIKIFLYSAALSLI